MLKKHNDIHGQLFQTSIEHQIHMTAFSSKPNNGVRPKLNLKRFALNRTLALLSHITILEQRGLKTKRLWCVSTPTQEGQMSVAINQTVATSL